MWERFTNVRFRVSVTVTLSKLVSISTQYGHCELCYAGFRLWLGFRVRDRVRVRYRGRVRASFSGQFGNFCRSSAPTPAMPSIPPATATVNSWHIPLFTDGQFVRVWRVDRVTTSSISATLWPTKLNICNLTTLKHNIIIKWLPWLPCFHPFLQQLTNFNVISVSDTIRMFHCTNTFTTREYTTQNGVIFDVMSLMWSRKRRCDTHLWALIGWRWHGHSVKALGWLTIQHWACWCGLRVALWMRQLLCYTVIVIHTDISCALWCVACTLTFVVIFLYTVSALVKFSDSYMYDVVEESNKLLSNAK